MQPAIERAFEEHAEKLTWFERHIDHNRPHVNWTAPAQSWAESPAKMARQPDYDQFVQSGTIGGTRIMLSNPRCGLS